jgi:hypothetical protein
VSTIQQQPKPTENSINQPKEDASLKKIVLKKTTTNAIPTVDETTKPKISQKLPETQTNLERKVSAAKKRRADEFAQIKKELLESAKLPQLSAIPKSKEASDDAKAKKTINAVAAAFSNTENPPTTTTTSTTSNAAAKSTVTTPAGASNNAAKPPASPSMGRRRFNNENTRLGHPSTQLATSNIKLKNVPPAQAINVTPSSSEFLTPVEPSPSAEVSSAEEKTGEKGAQSHARPNHSLAVPPESPKASRQKKFIDSGLAGRLQLDSHVLAKIDKIIAGGGKKLTVVSV